MKLSRITLSIAILAILASAAGAQEPRVLTLPPDLEEPRAVQDASGVLNLTCVIDKTAWYYTRSLDEDSWSDGLKVSGNIPVSAGRQRGPQLARTPEGAVAVLWQDRGDLHAAHRPAGANEFQPVSVRDTGESGIDMPALASGPDGTLVADWVDHRNELDEPVSGELWMATSTDGGRSFGPNRRISDTPVCPCCLPDIAIGANGNIYVAYRSTIEKIKEIRLLISMDGGHTFAGHQIRNDAWYFEGCPMSGPQLAVNDNGNALAVLWRKKKFYRLATTTDPSSPPSPWPDYDNDALRSPKLTASATGGFWIIDGSRPDVRTHASPADRTTKAYPIPDPPERVTFALPLTNTLLLLTP